MCIVKGKKSTGELKIRNHYLRGSENKEIKLLGLRGFATTEPDEAVRMMDVVRRVKDVDKPIYVAILNISPGERLSDEQFIDCADIIEKRLGLHGHQRIIVKHTKPIKNEEGQIIDEDHGHIHIIWNRYPPFEGNAVKIDNHYQAHQAAMVEIDKKYGLKPVITKTYSLTKAEIEEAKRHGHNFFQVRKRVSDAYLERKSPEEFQNKLQKMGMALCVGDKGQILVVLPWKKHKALSSLVEGRPRKAELFEALEPIRGSLEHIQVVLDTFVVRDPDMVMPAERVQTMQSLPLTKTHTASFPQTKTPKSSIILPQGIRMAPPKGSPRNVAPQPKQLPSHLSPAGRRRVEQWFKQNGFALTELMKSRKECAADYRLYKGGAMSLDAFLDKWGAFLGIRNLLSPSPNQTR